MTALRQWLLPIAIVPGILCAQVDVSKDFKFELGKPYPVIDGGKNYFYTGDGVTAIKVDGDKYFVQKLGAETLNQTCVKEYRDFPKGHTLERMMLLDGRLCVFYSTWDKGSETEELWVREVDPASCSFSGAGRSLVKVKGKITGTLVSGGWYNFSTVGKWTFVPSLDRERLLIKYRKRPEEKDDSKNKDVIGMVVFNDHLEEEWRSELTMPYTEEMMDNLDEAVDGEGNGYILATVREKTKKDVKRGEEVPAHLEVLRFGKGAAEFDVLPVDLGTMYIIDISFFEGRDGEMLCAGYYSKERKSTGAEGVFTFSIERTGAIGKVNHIDIPMDIINQNISERAQKKNEAREEDGKGVGIPNLRMEEIMVTEDGGMMMIGERFYMIQHTTKNGTYYTYHYEDMLVTSIGPDGQLEWMKKLAKKQMSRAVRGGCGFATFQAGNDLYLLFMDNVKNMGIGEDKVPAQHVDGQGGFLTGYKLDLNSGSVGKTSILDTREAKGVELFQVGIDRVVAVSDSEFLMEAYKKGKEDILVRVYMVDGKSGK